NGHRESRRWAMKPKDDPVRRRIEYAVLKWAKSRPRVLDQRMRRLARQRQERDCRALVDARDRRRCFFPNCRRYATDKHHLLPRSVRGVCQWHTDDLVSACREHHQWFKAGLIEVAGNPDLGPVTVTLTTLGREAGLRVPHRREVA